jgi:hypothetical protein
MYGSAIVGILGTPFTGYSFALTLFGGSLGIQRYKLSKS